MLFRMNCHSLVYFIKLFLNIVHDTFKTRAEKLQWGLEKLLKCDYKIEHNTQARREDYENVTQFSAYLFSLNAT